MTCYNSTAPIPPPGSLPVYDVFGVGSAGGTITTQNLVPSGAATPASSIELSGLNLATVTIQPSGSWAVTGGLSLQVTIDGETWITLSTANLFYRVSDGVVFSAIPSGSTDFFQAYISGYFKARITALGAVTVPVSIAMRGVSTIAPRDLSV